MDEWPGTVGPLKADVVPHMGWNTVQAAEGSRLFAGLPADARYYFVHSYAVRDWELEVGNPNMRAPQVTWATTASRSSPPSRTARCGPPSSTPRSPATPAPSCCPTGPRPSRTLRDEQARTPPRRRRPRRPGGPPRARRVRLRDVVRRPAAGRAGLAARGCRVAAPGRPRRGVRHRRQPRADRRGGPLDGHQGRTVRRHPRRRLPGGRARHRLQARQPRYGRAGDPGVGRQGHRRARRQDRRRPGRPRHHAARPRLDPRRRRPLRDAGPPRRSEGCARYVVTDINKDGTLQGPNLELLRGVCAATDRPVVASGGVSSLDDLRAIATLVPEGVEGAIVGKALYAKAFTLEEALEAVSS
ncbi:Imidazole glycerol phosphate synthase subunit HisH [Streptomyces rimosus subsp. rimosus]